MAILPLFSRVLSGLRLLLRLLGPLASRSRPSWPLSLCLLRSPSRSRRAASLSRDRLRCRFRSRASYNSRDLDLFLRSSSRCDPRALSLFSCRPALPLELGNGEVRSLIEGSTRRDRFAGGSSISLAGVCVWMSFV